MKLCSLVLMLAATSAAGARAQGGTGAAVNGGSDSTAGVDYAIDPKLADQIYERNVQGERRARPPRRGFGLQAELGQLRPERLTVQGDAYDVDYAEQLTALTGGAVRLVVPAARGDVAAWSLHGAVGYASRKGAFDARSLADDKTSHDDLTLSSTTALLGGQLDLNLGNDLVRPLARVEGGATRIAQDGTLAGIDRTAILPRAGASFGATLLPAPWRATDAGFDGVTVTAGYAKAFHRTQTFEGLTWDVGARFAF